MSHEHAVEYDGPNALSVTAADAEPARVRLRCGSKLPAGTNVCVTAGDYRAHCEAELAVADVRATDGAIDIVEGAVAESFFERNQRRQPDAGHQFRLASACVTEAVDRGEYVAFDLRVAAGGHAGNDLALDVRVRPPGAPDDGWERVGHPIVLSARDGAPTGFELRAQRDGRQLRATCFASDALLNPSTYPDPVTVEAVAGAVEGLPTRVSLADGPVRIAGRIVDGPVRLRATGSRDDRAATALLAADEPTPPGDRPLFGAIHFHTRHSADGGRPMPDAYRYARDTLGLDFVAATDHSPGHCWDEIAQTNARFHDPGSFVTIPAWEWSTSVGHANLYLRSTDSTATPDRDYDADQPYHVDWPEDAIMAPHHTNQRSNELNDDGEHYWHEYDWSVPNDRMGFVEVHQTRGNFEADDPDPEWRIKTGGIGASVRDALEEYRLGFVGGTDNHTGYPTRGGVGYADLRGRYCGLTGVYAGERTRPAIWDALDDRRTYATTGVPIRVGFAVNGEPLGGVTAAGGGDPTFAADLHGTAPIERVEVIADSETVWSAEPDDRDVHIAEEALPDPGDPGYYYLRLRQADRHMAWASPVWVEG